MEYVVFKRNSEYPDEEVTVSEGEVLPEFFVSFFIEKNGEVKAKFSFDSEKSQEIILSSNRRLFTEPPGYLDIAIKNKGSVVPVPDTIIHREYYHLGRGFGSTMAGGTLLKITVDNTKTNVNIQIYIVREAEYIDKKEDFYGLSEEYPWINYEVIELTVHKCDVSILGISTCSKCISGEVGKSQTSLLKKI